MSTIPLPKEINGKELTDVIRAVSTQTGFKYYDFSGEVSVERTFPEHVPRELRHVFDVTPHLTFRFGKIDPVTRYASLQCETMIGTMRLQPTDFSGDEEKYKPYYDRFVEGLQSHLK